MVKMIAIDLDGTLLNEKKQLSEENLHAIKLAQSQGVEVVIATGRAYFDVKAIFEHTGLKTWVISANGACIHTPSGDLFHHVPMEKKDALTILRWLEQHDFYYEVFSEDAILTPLNGRQILDIELDRLTSANPDVDTAFFEEIIHGQFSQTGFVQIDSSESIADDDITVYNILAFSLDEDKLLKGWHHFSDSPGLTLVKSAKHNFELEHEKAAKGIALDILAKKLGVPLAATAAVGDSFNDLSMLKVAGYSAAMGNAPLEIKQAADTVTLPNTENGVSHFIHELVKKTCP
ncbi:HAD family phosphatase [Bacillus sp. A301a_S52]|nr:HAD family phosphatase [Bacillus sp. A301a_S52]